MFQENSEKPAAVDAEPMSSVLANGVPCVLMPERWNAEIQMLCVHSLLARCESPLERRMLLALVATGYSVCPEAFAGCLAVTPVASIYPQMPIDAGGKRYRADFGCPELMLVIEVDGHDFHERTKQQAAHDRSRDRAMQREGWTVVRFTGSEVHSDAGACAAEVMATVKRLEDANPMDPTIVSIRAPRAQDCDRAVEESLSEKTRAFLARLEASRPAF